MGTPSEIPPAALLAGKIRLIQRIGRGGMGDVWVARNEATHAEVAVKTLQRSERTAVHDERFRREARLAATISHRNVVRIFDLVDEADGTLGLVMELLRGGTLEACVRERGPLSTMQSLAVASAILSALNHVHQKGIVHRDVKPANIFFAVEPDGHVIPKILDFGIAKLPAAASELTIDGSVLGTPHYMSPEQIRGVVDIDGRSDMFSLAIVLYEMLTGVRPFQRDSAAASLAAVLEHEVDPDPRIEPRLWVAISRALAKRPYERFKTCAEFADALRAAVAGEDDDFAAALQELRPRSDSIPDTDLLRVTAMSSSSRRSPKRRGKGAARRRSFVWALAAAGVAAALAVTVTLAVTHSGAAPAHADGTATEASSQTSTSAGQGASVRSRLLDPPPRDVIPAPSPTAERGAPSPPVAPFAPAGTVIATPLAAKAPSSPPQPPVTAGGGAPRAQPPPTPRGIPTTKPSATAKAIATSPGF